jgi:hypothetical protein
MVGTKRRAERTRSGSPAAPSPTRRATPERRPELATRRPSAAACACGGSCPRCRPQPTTSTSLSLAAQGRGGATRPLAADAAARGLGSDASAIRLFSGTATQAACDALGTPAYALDGDVFARSPTIAPRVLAHELHHAVEQRRHRKTEAVSRTPEHAAERRAEAFARGGATPTKGAAGPRSVPRLSLYSEVRDSAGATYQVADNLDVVVNKDMSAHELYASTAQVVASLAQLHRQDSILSLRVDTANTIRVTGPTPGGTTTPSRFIGPRWDAIRAGTRSQYLRWGVESPEVVTLQQALADADCPLPRWGVDGRYYDETRSAVRRFQGVKAGLPGDEVDGVVGPTTLAALDAHFGAGTTPTRTVSLPRVVPTNLHNGTSGPSMTMFNDCGYCASSIMGTLDWRSVPANPTSNSQIGAHFRRSPRGVYTRGGVERTTGRAWVHGMRDQILDAAMGTSAGGGFAAYKAATDKDRIERETGLNEYAAPGVGEAYAIARDMSGGSSYNYHWGAVIIASGNDRTVLENSWDSSQPLENNAWHYWMYGPGTQSFHSRYASSWAGPDPVTIRVRA